MYSIKHVLHINAETKSVFKALTTIEGLAGWWTLQTTGDASLGEYIEFRFGEVFFNKMKVIKMEQSNYVAWECVQGPPDWIGTEISFDLELVDGKTKVRFMHDKWEFNDDFYAQCSFSWGRYLESLRQLVETGTGAPFDVNITN